MTACVDNGLYRERAEARVADDYEAAYDLHRKRDEAARVALAMRPRDRDAVVPEVDEDPFVEQPVGTENTLGPAESVRDDRKPCRTQLQVAHDEALYRDRRNLELSRDAQEHDGCRVRQVDPERGRDGGIDR